MSCCCTRIYKLCDLIICDGEQLVLPIEVPEDGTYLFQMDFFDTMIEKEADLSAGDNFTFDKDELNEQFTYVGQIKKPDGTFLSFEIDGKTYDCIEFTTKKKSSDYEFVSDEEPSDVNMPSTTEAGSLNYIIDGGGSVITPGLKSFVEWGFKAKIKGWTILADVPGDIVVDVWRDSYGNYQPTVADTIAGTEKPTLVADFKNQDLSLSSFNTIVAKGDIWGFNVESVSAVKRVTIAFRFNKI